MATLSSLTNKLDRLQSKPTSWDNDIIMHGEKVGVRVYVLIDEEDDDIEYGYRVDEHKRLVMDMPSGYVESRITGETIPYVTFDSMSNPQKRIWIYEGGAELKKQERK